MKCGKPQGVSQILIGLHRVGLTGLWDALQDAEESGLDDPAAVTDRIIASLQDRNYIPEKQIDLYRHAIYREFLRHKGEDISDFYSEIDVSVRAAPGDERDRFIDLLTSVFGDFELTPKIEDLPATGGESKPELLIEDEVVVRGCVPREAFKRAVQRRITEW